MFLINMFQKNYDHNLLASHLAGLANHLANLANHLAKWAKWLT